MISKAKSALKTFAKRVLRRLGRSSLGRAMTQGEATPIGRIFLGEPMNANFQDRTLFLQGQIAARQIAAIPSIRTLRDVEFKVFSQWGEDGIIEWLVGALDLRENTFVEFGVENYREANTRFLVMNRNWRGLVMDGSSDHMASLREEEFYWRYDVKAAPAFVTAENINSLLEEHGFSGGLGILSIDIDGNDYWVLKAVDPLDAALLIVEYNPVFGDVHAVTTPYAPAFGRFDLHHSGLCFGASISAVRRLAEARGYTFVGSCSNGINAFFVRNDLAGRLEGKIAECKAWPGLHRDSRDRDGRLNHTGGTARLDQMKEAVVWDLEREREVRLGDLADPYSEEWARLIGGR